MQIDKIIRIIKTWIKVNKILIYQYFNLDFDAGKNEYFLWHRLSIRNWLTCFYLYECDAMKCLLFGKWHAAHISTF